MKTPPLIGRLKKAHDAYDKARQQTIASANAALHASKQAIFALNRGDCPTAVRRLSEAVAGLKAIERLGKRNPRLAHEGAYRAAQEEYAEAAFLTQLAASGTVTAIKGLDEETQIAGLCDAVGELVRQMVYAATDGRKPDVVRLKRMIDAIVGGLSEMDYGGYLRTKYDQARSHLRKAEDVLYDVSLRSR
jgi:predicted translin family RNA/ssDNA-binding protein